MSGDIEPTQAQLERFVARLADDGPFLMVNLNAFRDRAEYPADAGVEDTDVSGSEAYRRYAVTALRATAEVGARPLWGARTDVAGPLVGDDDPEARWDEVLVVWYPNRAAFLQMVQSEDYQASLVHRRAALARATLLPVGATDQPTLDLSTLLDG